MPKTKVSERDRAMFFRIIEADRQRHREVSAEVKEGGYDEQVAACTAARELCAKLVGEDVHPIYILGGMAMLVGALTGRWTVVSCDTDCVNTMLECFSRSFNYSLEAERDALHTVVGHA